MLIALLIRSGSKDVNFWFRTATRASGGCAARDVALRLRRVACELSLSSHRDLGL